jgi:hypothetical protein
VGEARGEPPPGLRGIEAGPLPRAP